MANYSVLGQIANQPDFQNRVAIALNVAATAVYSEAPTAATSAVSAAGSKTLTFASGAIPSWVAAGTVVSDLTASAAIPVGSIAVAVGATTITLSAAVVSPGVGNGDTISFGQHTKRAMFASNVVNGNYNIGAICNAVLVNATIQGEATVTGANNGIPDTDIQFQVNSIWNALAGA